MPRVQRQSAGRRRACLPPVSGIFVTASIARFTADSIFERSYFSIEPLRFTTCLKKPFVSSSLDEPKKLLHCGKIDKSSLFVFLKDSTLFSLCCCFCFVFLFLVFLGKVVYFCDKFLEIFKVLVYGSKTNICNLVYVVQAFKDEFSQLSC